MSATHTLPTMAPADSSFHKHVLRAMRHRLIRLSAMLHRLHRKEGEIDRLDRHMLRDIGIVPREAPHGQRPAPLWGPGGLMWRL